MRPINLTLSLLLLAGGVVSVSRADQPTRKGVVAPHSALCNQCEHGEGLGFFDIRLHDPQARAAALAEALPAGEKTRAAAFPLQAADRFFAIDLDEALGTPLFVRTTAGTLTGTRPEQGWREVVVGFIAASPAVAGIDRAELDLGRVTRDFTLPGGGTRNVTLQQTHDGIDLFGAILRVSITARGELLTYSSTLLPRPREGFSVPGVQVSPSKAVELAAADAGITLDGSSLTPEQTEDGPAQATTWKAPASLRADEPVQTRLVYFPLTRTRIVPAWSVVVPRHGVGHTYDTVIDATDGRVLHRVNRLLCAQPITFNVFTADSPSPFSPASQTPSTFQPPLVPRNVVTVTPAEVAAWSPQGWIPDGTTITSGNNVDAYTDTDNNNLPDATRTDGGALLNFDFPLDLANAPATYADAAVVQMFYWSNRFHDRFYALGFTEQAGNFQLSNLGQGGSAGDYVRAEVQDGGGTNNANFSTSGADGSTARCQMYIFNGPNPDRDGALDSDIVYHELGHGLSVRLHGGLNQVQSAGMGEGWSDFVALSLNSSAGEDPGACHPLAAYATYDYFGQLANYYFGFRRYPYSTDMSKSPLTFGDIDSATYSVPGSAPRNTGVQTNFGVHQLGEVWCSTLWDCRAGMIGAYGFDGNERMLQLVVDGMAASPSSPSFIQSRDAVLAADNARNGGANLGRLWTAMARRGMGISAVGVPASGTAGTTEAFDVPAITTFTYPSGLPTQLSPTEATTFTVSIVGTGLTIDPGSAVLQYRVGGGPFTSAPLAPAGTDTYVATIPALPCLSRVDYYITVNSSAGQQASPSTAPAAFNTALVFTSESIIISDAFVTNSGWTTGPNTASQGNWVRGDPLGTAAQPDTDHSPGDDNCWFTGQGTGGAVGEADVDGGRTVLTSPIYDLSASIDATVSYWRWYSNGLGSAPNADVFTVQVSVDGGSTWVNGEVVGPGNSIDTQPGWRKGEWSLSSLGLTPSSTVRVRFIADDAGSGSLIEAAVDDFEVRSILCDSGPQPCGLADLGQQGGVAGADGLLNNNDFVAFIDAFFAQAPAADLGVQGGVPGSDGLFNNNDFVAFIDLFFAGC